MARTIATVHGTALVPGVSRNGRLYTAEVIAKAVERAQERLSQGAIMDVRNLDGGGVGKEPMTQRTHHAADDDSTRIAGRVTALTLDEATGAAKFTATLANTAHGNDILELIDTSDGQPAFLRGVSIRGAWLGPVARQMHEGRTVETADDLELDGLDYTAKPGVTGAGVEKVERTNPADHPRETATERVLIYESVQEAVVESVPDPDTTEASEPEPAVVEEKGAVALKSGKPATAQTTAKRYADPGYQGDKMPRYALDTKAQAKAAWSYINQADNAKAYTGNQLKRIKERIVKALKGFGVQVDTKERWIISPAAEVTEALAEHFDMDPHKAGSFYVTLSNGPVSVSVSSYCIDPADLDLIGRAAMDGACQALAALDPDMDGDIDVPGAEAEDTDGDMETTRETTETAPAESVPETPAPTQAAETTTPPEETVVTDVPTTQAAGEQPATTETTPAAAPAVGAVTLTAEMFQQLLTAATVRTAPASAAAPVETAPPAVTPATEAAAPAAPAAVVESDDARITRLVEERMAANMDAMRQQITQDVVAQSGPPQRRGLQRPVTETGAPATPTGLPADWPQKPLHTYTAEERDAHFGPALTDYVVGNRLPPQ